MPPETTPERPMSKYDPDRLTPKYEIIPTQYITLESEDGYKTKAYRTRALRDFEPSHGDPVKKGDFGPFIENVHNLSRENDRSWAEPTVVLIGSAKVRGNAYVGGHMYANDGTLEGNSVVRAAHLKTPDLLVRAETTEDGKIKPSSSLPPLRLISLNPPEPISDWVLKEPEVPVIKPGSPSGTPPAPRG